MRPASLRFPVRVVAVAMLLAAGASFAVGRADASALRLAAAGSPRSAGGTWGTAIEVPGTAALNQGGYAQVASVSCRSAGNCSAGGTYRDASGHQQAFVVGETDGTWGTAIEAPGSAALNSAGDAGITSVSCGSAGNCGAGGDYEGSDGFQVFVVSETGGTWGTTEQVPGIAALDQAGPAYLYSVSCGPKPGYCTAGGNYYVAATKNVKAYVVSENAGTWGTAQKAPLPSALSTGDSSIASVSCPTAGNCIAGGYAHTQAYVVGQTGGKWGTAIEVPGITALGAGSQIISVSCATVGNCTAGGFYDTSGSGYQPFVVSETGGTWGTAQEVPGIAALNTGGQARITSVSCGAAGDCSAGGWYRHDEGLELFVDSETDGTWGTAEEVPGTGEGEFNQVSCGAPGNCSAGGANRNGSSDPAFVVSETDGTWGTATGVSGLNSEFTAVNSVSCAAAGTCTAGGSYDDASGYLQAFVVSETPGTGTSAGRAAASAASSRKAVARSKVSPTVRPASQAS
jgi:hypothetical protein